MSPLNLKTLFDPFAVLVHHTVDNMDERLVAIKQTMSARQDIALEPALIVISDVVET